MIVGFLKKLFAIKGEAQKKSSKAKRNRAVKKTGKKLSSKTSGKKRVIKKGKPVKRKKTKKVTAKKKTVSVTLKKPRQPAASAKVKKTKKIAEQEIGKITHYFDKISVGIVKLKRPLKVNDAIHIKGAHTDFIQVVTSLQVNRKDIDRALTGAEVGIKVVEKVHENDRVYVAR